MWSDHVRWEDVSEEGRKSAPIDLRNASLEEMLLLEGIGEVSAKKIFVIRGTGMPITILRKIPHFNIKRVQALIDRGLVRPLQPDDDDEVDVKSAVTATADPWMSILKSERTKMDHSRPARDPYSMEMEYMRQKEAELDRLLKRKEIEMEEKLRRFFKQVNLLSALPTLRVWGVSVQICMSCPTSMIPQRRKEERRHIKEMARNVPTDSICRGKAFDKTSPLGNSSPRQPTTATSEDASYVEMRKPGIPRQPTTATPEDASSVEMWKPSIPTQLTTSNHEDASSVEMRKPDTRTYSSSRDIRTPVAAMSVTPDGVMVESPEDLPSPDDPLYSDIPSEKESYKPDETQARSRGQTSIHDIPPLHKNESYKPDEAQARSRGSDQYPRHSSPPQE